MCRATLAAGPDADSLSPAGRASVPIGSLMDEPSTAAARARARLAALQQRAEHIAERTQAERSRHSSLDALFEMVDRDSEVGGGIMAGALAYRLFIWLLPLALVAVAGLGIASNAESSRPESLAKSAGLAGLVSGSVASAADSSARWYALLVGIPILLYATRSVLRTLIVAHRLVWTDLRAHAPRPTLKAIGPVARDPDRTARLSRSSRPRRGAVRARSGSWRRSRRRCRTRPSGSCSRTHLPHRDATWQALLSRAVLFGLGIEVLHLVTVYFIAPFAGNKQGTYGALGLAAALLLELFLLSRLVVATAVVNATLWARRSRDAAAAQGK